MNPTQPTNNSSVPSGLDPTAFYLTKSIKATETGGSANAYTQPGKSGEYGAYQYTEPTWNGDVQKYLGQNIPLNQATPEQQNQVAYSKVSDLLKQGYTQSQVASIWNSNDPQAGQGTFSKGNLAGQASVGTNGSNVHYNVPQYVDNVKKNYMQYASGIQQPAQASPTIPPVVGSPTAFAADGSAPSKPESLVDRGIDATKNVIGTAVKGPATLAVRAGELGGVGLMGLYSKLTGDPGYYNRALQAVNTQTQGPLGMDVKANNQETPESLMGEGASTVAFGIPNPTISGGLFGAGNAMQNNGSALNVAGQAGLGAALGYGVGKLSQGISSYLSPESSKIASTLSEKLNYSPEVAEDIASTFDRLPNVSSYIDQGNLGGARAILNNALRGSTGTEATDLSTAFHAIDDLSTLQPEGAGLMSRFASGAGSFTKKTLGKLAGAALTGASVYEGTNPNSFVRQFLSTGNPQ